MRRGAMTRGRATIADVAAAAGVSKATVSRFLNHRDRLLSADIAAAPATGCARRLTALAISFGIILVRSWFIFSSWSKSGMNG